MKSDFASFVDPYKQTSAEEDASSNAFDSFLLTLSEQLSNLKKINNNIQEESVISNDYSYHNNETNYTNNYNTKNYLSFLEELESIQKTTSELPEENKDITNISSQINDELKKFKLQLGRMALEGGGGTNAVQYANGGYMDGDLLVSGNITSLGRVLQDGNDLSTDITNIKTFIQTNSAGWGAGSGGSDVSGLSGNWESTYSTVKENSGTWGYDGSDLKALSGNWESTYTTFRDTSSSWVGLGEMKFAIDIVGNNIDTIFTYPHGLGTSDLVANVYDTSTNTIVLVAISADNTNISVDFADPFTNTYRLVAIGAGQPAVSLGTVVADSAKWNSTNTTVRDFSSSWGFNLTKISVAGNYTQTDEYSHFVYDDDAAGSGINVELLPVVNHTGVKTHKKIGITGTVTLNPPAGVLIDGAPVYVLNTQYQSVQLYTDGTDYLIQ
jgi:hypothetical protein